MPSEKRTKSSGHWEWEVEVPDLDTSVFIIPDALVQNGEERLVVLNRTAMSIVNDVRGMHREFVFTYNGKRILKMNNTAWQKGRVKAGLPQVLVHDLKHTFGRRLRAAGVSFLPARPERLIKTAPTLF